MPFTLAYACLKFDGGEAGSILLAVLSFAAGAACLFGLVWHPVTKSANNHSIAEK